MAAPRRGENNAALPKRIASACPSAGRLARICFAPEKKSHHFRGRRRWTIDEASAMHSCWRCCLSLSLSLKQNQTPLPPVRLSTVFCLTTGQRLTCGEQHKATGELCGGIFKVCLQDSSRKIQRVAQIRALNRAGLERDQIQSGRWPEPVIGALRPVRSCYASG